MHTWISRVTVGALVIAWHGMYQVLQSRLITRLLALAQRARHDTVVTVQRCIASRPSECSRGKCARESSGVGGPGCSSYPSNWRPKRAYSIFDGWL